MLFVTVMSVLLAGCDNANPPTDMVDGSDVANEFVGDTADATEIDTTNTTNVDVVEDEVVVSPCADYEWLNNNFWCCPNGGQCEWRTCSINEVDGECLVFCEKTLNNKPVDSPLVIFSPPDSFSLVNSDGNNKGTCSL
ncbi:MAG: hypothetical protein L3J07_00140 [Candidatus Magasanikbacteria bacterium]|nr:hypothetical protein [Candidatus Magasanikbacteria bacterium]